MWAVTSPCSPGDTGSVPPVCPQLLSHGSPRSLESCSCSSQRAGTPQCIQTITSALEPCPAAWGPPAAGQPVCCVATPALSPGCGTERAQAAPLLTSSSLRCCPAHPPQGNQTPGIFWSFVVKLFPNSSRFKCHHTNGRENPFMQLQSGFLRWLGY